MWANFVTFLSSDWKCEITDESQKEKCWKKNTSSLDSVVVYFYEVKLDFHVNEINP